MVLVITLKMNSYIVISDYYMGTMKSKSSTEESLRNSTLPVEEETKIDLGKMQKTESEKETAENGITSLSNIGSEVVANEGKERSDTPSVSTETEVEKAENEVIVNTAAVLSEQPQQEDDYTSSRNKELGTEITKDTPTDGSIVEVEKMDVMVNTAAVLSEQPRQEDDDTSSRNKEPGTEITKELSDTPTDDSEKMDVMVNTAAVLSEQLQQDDDTSSRNKEVAEPGTEAIVTNQETKEEQTDSEDSTAHESSQEKNDTHDNEDNKCTRL